MALMEKAAGQGHAYAMFELGSIHNIRKEHERAVEWLTKGAEAGLPMAMFNLGACLDQGQGVAAPDYPAAAGCYRRAANAGDASAAGNLAGMYEIGRGRGVIDNKHLTDVESSTRVSTSVHAKGKSCSDLARVLVLNDPPPRRHAQ